MKSKEELKKEMNEKNRLALSSGCALKELMIHNLENFAYRYIETEGHEDIKCEQNGETFFVTSIEENIYSALKWNNKNIKPKLIELCKKYPGKKAKEIKVQLMIGSTLKSDDEIECFATLNWDFPEFKLKSEEERRVVKFKFDDVLELRNKHANLLEDVCEIF